MIKKIRYVVVVNMPGYMPESDLIYCTTLREARLAASEEAARLRCEENESIYSSGGRDFWYQTGSIWRDGVAYVGPRDDPHRWVVEILPPAPNEYEVPTLPEHLPQVDRFNW